MGGGASAAKGATDVATKQQLLRAQQEAADAQAEVKKLQQELQSVKSASTVITVQPVASAGPPAQAEKKDAVPMQAPKKEDPPVKATPKRAASSSKPKPQASGGDGETSASKVVGGNWKPPKTANSAAEDAQLLAQWCSDGKAAILEGVWCCVPYKVTVVKADAKEDDLQAKALTILNAVKRDAETIFSHFVETSEISKINGMPENQTHKPSGPMQKVLSMVNTLNRATGGTFDPAVHPLALHYKNNGSIDDADSVAAYSKWSMFKLSDDGISKTDANAQLDLCGLAKGWAIDEMSEKLTAGGFTANYVNWGGDIRVSGTHPSGRNWTASVVAPPSIEEIGAPVQEDAKTLYLANLELRDGQSLATSGDYLQTLAQGLSHIVDPKGGPIKITGNTCASISVVTSKSCMLADALATAAMASKDVKKGRLLLDRFRNGGMSDPVEDYLLYARDGPQVCRMRVASSEPQEMREDRLARHQPATVVVIGGGLAGASAALEAHYARAKVILIEKEARIGGNSAKATSGINACGTRVQAGQGVTDDGRWFERDTHVSAKGGTSNLGCVSMLSDKSAEAIHWLMDEVGVPLTNLSQLGGHARKRTHRVPPRTDGTPVPVGYTIMEHMKAAIEQIEDIEVKTSCSVTGLIRNGPDEISGVEYKDADGTQHTITCDGVVVTSGGFGFDCSAGSLMAQHRPDLLGVCTTNGSFATGDGVRLGEAIGATLVDMDKVQLHPTAFIDPKDPGNHTKYLGPEALRGSGGLLLDQKGRRFINELELRSTVSNKILEHCDAYKATDGTEYRPYAWCVLNEESQNKFGTAMLSFYKDQVGLFQAVDGTKGLAEVLDCPEENLIETLKAYGAAVDQKICSATGKAVFPTRVSEKDTNFIVARITPTIHYCMGGLEISPMGEVMTALENQPAPEPVCPNTQNQALALKGGLGKRKTIRRLYAAGEVTGGVHGNNRLGGNSLLECVVYGRLAGERAATVKQPASLLDSGDWIPVVLREVRATDEQYGNCTRVYRFNLHGSLQTTGLEVGRFISIRGELDGNTLTGYYSPISRPDDQGIIDILCRMDEKGGPIVSLLQSMAPGGSCWMKGMGGVKLVRQPDNPKGIFSYNGRLINKLSLLCGGTGLAPALQITRAYLKSLSHGDTIEAGLPHGIKIVYAAESVADLAFIQAFDKLKARFPKLIEYYIVLNQPPSGWTQGLGFVDQDIIRKQLWFPPADDQLCVMCGPPIFEKIMSGNLSRMGYPSEQFYSFAADNA